MRTANLLASATLTVLVGLTAVSGASAAVRAPATAPKPPVVPEPWNPPFACNQHSNLGVQGCADCTSQSDEYEGGTQQPLEYMLCLAVDDQSRITDLRGFYEDLVQGRKDVPEFP